jgi:hypothetical protein
VRMTGPEVAAAWAGVSTRLIYRWLEAAQLHFVEGPEGVLFVCLRSLNELLAALPERACGDPAQTEARTEKTQDPSGSHQE